MLFGRKDKNKPSDRVLDLKARVDALRAADQATRKEPVSLDHFLEGDDVLAGRVVEDDYQPSGFDPSAPSPPAGAHFEANLQAELDKYIQRQQEVERAAESKPASQPKAAPSNEDSGSFLLDGTWSRNNAGSTPASSSPAPDTGWPAKGDAWGSSFDTADGSGTQTDWSVGKDWPAEEEWPPREEAV